MAKYTTNYNLTKIDLTDAPPDITVLNQNWDTIDRELGTIGETVEEALSNLTPEKIGAQPAKTAINTGNIGSQSVDYANRAGAATDADTVDGWHIKTEPREWGLKPIVATNLDLQANAQLTTGYIYLVYE